MDLILFVLDNSALVINHVPVVTYDLPDCSPEYFSRK